jgi:hypothetical protein
MKADHVAYWSLMSIKAGKVNANHGQFHPVAAPEAISGVVKVLNNGSIDRGEIS